MYLFATSLFLHDVAFF